uniref:Uncharacterized protein n=1 Tax=Neobodo designis TaxID=312471 RepID=A0A7S1QB99_NEODS|mmetsp:Transcript_3698/g.11695  ORF Transcript_3698/g.11695 Transcript_3698/m.11695 type:complete len:442 (+) Transcript_3698:413-1738(+)
MGCCHSRRVGSESDAELCELPGEDQLHEQLDEMALSASSADTADEPLPCTASLRERLIVFRASMRHNINDDPNQFAEFARTQEPELQPRDARRAAQWVDDVLRHAAAASTGTVACPVVAYDTFRTSLRNLRAGPAMSANAYAAALANPQTSESTTTGTTDGDDSAAGDDPGAPPPVLTSGMQQYVATATRHVQRLQRAFDEQQQRASGGTSYNSDGPALPHPHSDAALPRQHQRPGPGQRNTSSAGSGGGNSRGITVDARGVFVSHSDQSDSDMAGDVDLAAGTHTPHSGYPQAHPNAGSTTTGRSPRGSNAHPNNGHNNSGSRPALGVPGERNPLCRRSPRHVGAAATGQPQSYARRMLLQQAGTGFRSGARGMGPRGGRPPPARSLADQQVSFTYSESSDADDASDGECSPPARDVPVPPLAGSGGTPVARRASSRRRR